MTQNYLNADVILSTAFRVADAAAVETLKWFRAPQLLANNKLQAGYDPVTQADRAAEYAMRSVLDKFCPNDAVVGEEEQDKLGTSGLSWVLDPIDGTRGYMSGTPTWGTLIALNDGVSPVLGIIDQPYIGERYVGGLGHAFMERKGVRVSLQTRATSDLSDAIIFTTFPEVGSAKEAEAFRAVADACKLVRYGMDCYAYALLAAGHIDLVIEADLKSYDIQAPIALVRAAGGIATNWAGDNPMNGGSCICAANAQVHASALKILKHYDHD